MKHNNLNTYFVDDYRKTAGEIEKIILHDFIIQASEQITKGTIKDLATGISLTKNGKIIPNPQGAVNMYLKGYNDNLYDDILQSVRMLLIEMIDNGKIYFDYDCFQVRWLWYKVESGKNYYSFWEIKKLVRSCFEGAKTVSAFKNSGSSISVISLDEILESENSLEKTRLAEIEKTVLIENPLYKEKQEMIQDFFSNDKVQIILKDIIKKYPKYTDDFKAIICGIVKCMNGNEIGEIQGWKVDIDKRGCKKCNRYTYLISILRKEYKAAVERSFTECHTLYKPEVITTLSGRQFESYKPAVDAMKRKERMLYKKQYLKAVEKSKESINCNVLKVVDTNKYYKVKSGKAVKLVPKKEYNDSRKKDFIKEMTSQERYVKWWCDTLQALEDKEKEVARKIKKEKENAIVSHVVDTKRKMLLSINSNGDVVQSYNFIDSRSYVGALKKFSSI